MMLSQGREKKKEGGGRVGPGKEEPRREIDEGTPKLGIPVSPQPREGGWRQIPGQQRRCWLCRVWFISPILSAEGFMGPQAGTQSFGLGTGEAPTGKSAACTGGICRPVPPAVGDDCRDQGPEEPIRSPVQDLQQMTVRKAGLGCETH